MRRYTLILLFFLVLILPFVMRHWLVAQSAPAEEGAKIAGKPLVIISPHNQDIRREFAVAFRRWHLQKYGSAVDLDFRSIGGTNDIERLLRTTYDAHRVDGKLPAPEALAGQIGYEVVWGGGDNFFDTNLKPLGILVPLDSRVVKEAIPDPMLSGSRLYDYNKDDPKAPILWAGVCLSSFGIVYNPDLLHALKIPNPTRWQDLADPRLSGMVALADPTHSGSAAITYMVILQRSMADAEDEFFAQADHVALRKMPREKWPAQAVNAYNDAIAAGWKAGMGMMLRIAANARYFTDSAETVATDVGNGDAACGMAIDFYGRVEEATVGSARARYVAPFNATVVTCDPVAILYGTTGERLTLANHFVEFLLSREGQLLWIKRPGTPGGPQRRALGRPPIRRDLYADQTDWSDPVNPFADAGSFSLRQAWMGTFGELRATLWAAAWIDDRDALRDAYAKILAVKDESKRNQLLAQLSDLPVGMKSVLATANAQKSAANSKSSDSGAASARARMDWAIRFRQHYVEVWAKAD